MTTPGTSPTCVCTAKDATSANHGAAHQSRHATDQASSSTSTKGSSVTLGFQMSNGIGSITTMYAVRRSDAHTRRGRPPRRCASARIPTAAATLIAVARQHESDGLTAEERAQQIEDVEIERPRMVPVEARVRPEEHGRTPRVVCGQGENGSVAEQRPGGIPALDDREGTHRERAQSHQCDRKGGQASPIRPSL